MWGAFLTSALCLDNIFHIASHMVGNDFTFQFNYGHRMLTETMRSNFLIVRRIEPELLALLSTEYQSLSLPNASQTYPFCVRSQGDGLVTQNVDSFLAIQRRKHFLYDDQSTFARFNDAIFQSVRFKVILPGSFLTLGPFNYRASNSFKLYKSTNISNAFKHDFYLRNIDGSNSLHLR
uniref:Uncharacterized protein n=1 Tax=Romanomermis culicivorax TaxID=13658 RepID=A0A915J294_ROMCU